MHNPFNFISVFLGNWFGNWFLFSGFSRILKNPMALFVYGIISKWYIAVTLAAIVVTFWVFKGLSDAGVVQNVENVIFEALNDSKSIAKHCVPKILDPAELWECIQNPPAYEPSESEKALEDQLNNSLHPDNATFKETQNPYEQQE